MELANISSIPQRSPFRYPGGKTWLVPTIRKWLGKQGCRTLFEPFCGGGIVSLTAVCEGLTESAVMVEKDANVAAVWETILSDGDWLANRILDFDMSVESVSRLILEPPKDVRETAFQTIVRNRVNYGGIMTDGSGLLKNGEKRKGIGSRWYPETLARRIKDIAMNKSRIIFHHGDAFDFIRDGVYDDGDCYYIDPPYVTAGKRLYNLCDIDHDALFEAVRSLRCRFIMSYDKCDHIVSLADANGLSWREIPMRTTHGVVKTELLISDTFDWLE